MSGWAYAGWLGLAAWLGYIAWRNYRRDRRRAVETHTAALSVLWEVMPDAVERELDTTDIDIIIEHLLDPETAQERNT